MEFPLLPLWNGLTGALDALAGSHCEERPSLSIEYDAARRRKGAMIITAKPMGRPAMLKSGIGRAEAMAIAPLVEGGGKRAGHQATKKPRAKPGLLRSRF